ncbi:hypothetical protein BD413DRAFT_611361 [Trametes elegans]|nr:hypothetical protein BD413DRAFT_611361 [Trametes elegans]
MSDAVRVRVRVASSAGLGVSSSASVLLDSRHTPRRPHAKSLSAFAAFDLLAAPPSQRVVDHGPRPARAPSLPGAARARAFSPSSRALARAPAADTRSPASLAMSNLNGDILSHVASHLRGRDALNLALTSRRLYDFAIHRVAVALVCRTLADLHTLHHHLLLGEPKRAVHLRSLTILSSIFVDRPWQDDPNWLSPKTTYQYTHASLVGDILQAASNLTHLKLEHFSPLLENDTRIGPAIAAMTSLVTVELSDVDSNALPVFASLRSEPRVLRISPVHVHSTVDVQRVLDMFQCAFGSLSYNKKLRALDLDLKPVHSPPESPVACPQLPQVRCLSVRWMVPHFDVAKTFPNIDILDQHIYGEQLRRSPDQPLRRLSICDLQTFESSRHPVHLLYISRYARDVRTFRRTIYETSPVGVSMHCFMDTPHWLKYWRQLPRAAPRLRFADIHCHTFEKDHEPGWVSAFIESFRSCPLVCIRIIAPQPPRPSPEEAPWHADDVQMLAELPDRIVHAMPTLRYVAWAPKRRPPGDYPEDYAWYEDGFDCAPAEYKWYRVERGEGAFGGERTLRPISQAQGERVRRFLLEAELEEITNIDDHLRL